ncbi:hypothetical protein Ccrd_017267, partial [Cynara cardunculus var. scolymus]
MLCQNQVCFQNKKLATFQDLNRSKGFIDFKQSILMFFFILIISPAAEHECLKRGVKEVVKSIRR